MNNPPRQQRPRRRPANMSLKSLVAEAINKPLKRTLRNRRRNANRRKNRITTGIPAGEPYISKPYVPMSFIPPSMSLGQSSAIRTMNSSLRQTLRTAKVTADGLAFLKCAFAPPDFAASSVRGVPDQFEGKSLTKKHRLTSNFDNPAGRDSYILILPIPGIAYFTFNLAAGTPLSNVNAWGPVSYGDSATLFPSQATSTDNVTKFRYVSQHVELVPTVNAMQWSGSITAWKINPQVMERSAQAALTDGLRTVTGLNQTLGAQTAEAYSGPVINGIFAGTYSSSSVFEFSPIFDSQGSIPINMVASDFQQLIAPGTTGIPGFDNGFESLCIKITNTGAQNTFVIRNYACVEYIASPTSGLYEYQMVSCNDAVAIALYKQIIKELPVGVHYMDNENFWRRVLNIIRMVSGSLAILPGPYGAMAGGVNAISTGINELTM